MREARGPLVRAVEPLECCEGGLPGEGRDLQGGVDIAAKVGPRREEGLAGIRYRAIWAVGPGDGSIGGDPLLVWTNGRAGGMSRGSGAADGVEGLGRALARRSPGRIGVADG